ncbi:hypothetical protein [Agromyces salentinus]|uniref:WxL domain-containing protein n=1 Tax=Agromyces salentinus TaxID=269421 RepID=A0ABN2MFH0_9MICO|nr:hypothetical protein [Agromyces salentinus]
MTKSTLRLAAITAATGALLLAGNVGIAVAEEQHGGGEVDVNVAITEITEPGVLAMSIAGTEVSLTENGSEELVRQFTGTLPTVTITDTRTAEEIPEGAAWYVLGTATAFAGDAGQEPIGAGHLGWAPALVDGGDSGLVAAGDAVETVLDDDAAPDNVGLVDQELFASAYDSGEIAPEGSWTANADLFLRTPATVDAGQYTGTITLSLFE